MQPILKPCFKIKRGHWKTCRAKNAPYLGRTSPYPPFHWVPPHPGLLWYIFIVRRNTRGGHWPRKRVWGCAALKTPFHASPAARKGPISSKRVSSQDPLLRKFGNFSLYSLIFHPNFSSQAPNFGNFQLTSPKNWKFSAHKPPNCEIFRSQAPKFWNFPLTSPHFQRQIAVRKPHTSEIRAAHPYLKKSWVPPPGRNTDPETKLSMFCLCYRKIISTISQKWH